MNDTFVTMIGNAVEDPVRRVTRDRQPYVTFRLASTPRRRTEDGYVDGNTNFVTVTAWRQLALNVDESIRKGHPLVVTGRLRVTQWQAGDKSGTSVDLDATSIGHDLNRGITRFTRVKPARPGDEGQGPGAAASPADASGSTRPDSAPDPLLRAVGWSPDEAPPVEPGDADGPGEDDAPMMRAAVGA